MSGRTKVLVVDDSAFARRTLTQILSADERLDVVGYARDGLDALEKVSELAPDVITLDLLMPELDGVGVLRALAERAVPPRVVVVTTTARQSELGIEALEVGAFDIVEKPTALATDRLFEIRNDLVAKVVAAGASRAPATLPVMRPAPRPQPAERLVDCIVIGASTGGPRAVSDILLALPAELAAPIAVVVHMPVGYTDVFARRLDDQSRLSVREAFDGLVVEPGAVVIARAGEHLRLECRRGEVVCRTSLEPAGTLHRPSVDELFTSAASAFGPTVLGVVLTGMGVDGADGAERVHARGGRVLVEAASTCVVHGMPRAVVERGCADAEVPLYGMAQAVVALTGVRSDSR